MGQFSKVFRNPMNRSPSRLPQIVPAPHRSLASSYQKEGFYNSWNQTDDNKATGPDQIPGKLLKTCANKLASVFAILFQASLDQGIEPDDWKLALISPLYKKADKKNVGNYHQISLTSIVCKLLKHYYPQHHHGLPRCKQHSYRLPTQIQATPELQIATDRNGSRHCWQPRLIKPDRRCPPRFP